MRLIDLTGQRFGQLTVKEYNGKQKWKCICDCGNECIKDGYRLLHGKTTNCNQKHKHPKLDLTGQHFEHLTALKYLGDSKWDCLCDCGNHYIANSFNLVHGISKHCSSPMCQCSKHRYNVIANLPDILAYWDYDKNTMSPNNVFSSSTVKCWWICKNGHSYLQSVKNKVYNKDGCPYCTNKLPIKGINDLETLYPDIVSEWDYKKNEKQPSDYLPSSNQKVWWVCKRGHSWQSVIYNRTKLKVGCPHCRCYYKSSFEDCALFYYFKQVDENIQKCSHELGFELDIYIPELKIAIEYDGGFWHKNTEGADKNKNKKCLNKNITLYRIREYPLKPLNDSSTDIIVKSREELQSVIHNLIFQIYGKDVTVNFAKDKTNIDQLVTAIVKPKTSIVDVPQMFREYDISKNTTPPQFIAIRSNIKRWWTCQSGHTYSMSADDRYTIKCCPYCSGARGRRIRNIDTKEEFNTVIEAAKRVGLNASGNIVNCLKGKLKRAAGYHWEYIYDQPHEWEDYVKEIEGDQNGES